MLRNPKEIVDKSKHDCEEIQTKLLRNPQNFTNKSKNFSNKSDKFYQQIQNMSPINSQTNILGHCFLFIDFAKLHYHKQLSIKDLVPIVHGLSIFEDEL